MARVGDALGIARQIAKGTNKLGIYTSWRKKKDGSSEAAALGGSFLKTVQEDRAKRAKAKEQRDLLQKAYEKGLAAGKGGE